MIGCSVNLTSPSTNVGRVDPAGRARYNEGALPKGANCRRPQLRSSAVFLSFKRCGLGAAVAVVVMASASAEHPPVFLPMVMGGRPAAECSPSYPTICLHPPPPDLDCDEIPHTDFPVLPPDEHHLDADSDGIGCESE